MDNITHTLFAATLARTPLGRAGRGATAALVLASNAPDIDILATSGGTMNYLEWHRGPTHGPLGIVGLGLVTAALVWTGRKVVDRHGTAVGVAPERDDRRAVGRTSSDSPSASFARLATISIAAVLVHVLMDLPTSYGLRLLSPFDWHWYALDWMPIIDIYLWIVLAAGLLVGRGSEAAGQRAAAIVLALMAANYGLRAAAHERAIAVAPRVFGPLLPGRCEGAPPRTILDRWPRATPAMSQDPSGRCLVEIAATPGFSSPFEWRLIARSSDAYHVRSINLIDLPFSDAGAVRPARGWPNVWTPVVFRAADTRPAQVFLGFSRFPAVRVWVDHTGAAMVQWTDMRFSGGPDPPRPQDDGRGDLFGATVRISPDGHVLDARLGGR